VSVWQPGDHIGAGRVNGPGALSWNELWTTDVAGAEEFYGGLFGWTPRVMDELGGYHVIVNGERTNGGIQALTPEMAHVPPNWSVAFGSDDVDRTVAAAEEAGAGVVIPPTAIGDMGRFAVLADPQGAVFTAYEGQFDD
jgi:predicted enzyme related to lactoylglutathione lyase